jgi:hypothetical protein
MFQDTTFTAALDDLLADSDCSTDDEAAPVNESQFNLEHLENEGEFSMHVVKFFSVL